VQRAADRHVAFDLGFDAEISFASDATDDP